MYKQNRYKIELYKSVLKNNKNLLSKNSNMLDMEITKLELLWNGLKFGLEAMRCKKQNRPMREQLMVALKRGEVYVPATFFQLGYPISDPHERVMDPRQGRSSLDNMLVFI